MKFTANRKELTQAVKQASLATAKSKSWAPASSCVVLKVLDSTVEVSGVWDGVDISSWAVCADAADGMVAVNAKAFLDAIGASKDKTVAVFDTGASIHVGSVSIPAMPIADMPERITVDVPTLPNDGCALLDALDAVTYAATKDPFRPALNVVRIQTTGEFVATDAHRMAWYSGPRKLFSQDVSVPLRTVNALRKLLPGSNVVDAGGAGTIKVRGERWTLIAPAVSDSFPAWEQVIPGPSETDISVTVDVQALTAAIKPVAKASGVTIHCNGAMTLTTGEVSTRLVYSRTDCSQAERSVGLNPKYLAEAIKGLTGDITLTVPSDKYAPVAFRAGACKGVIMPLRK